MERIAVIDQENQLLAGVELGGTKSIVVLARGRTIVERAQIATGPPADTLAGLAALLEALQSRHGPAAALGIASFGPLRVQPTAPDYGHLLQTPKPGWSGVDIRGALSAAVEGPCTIDTDVNGAALAEGQWGASRGCDVHIYITVGTGIGGGIIAGGRPLHGALHPELGHVRVRRSPGDSFPGICPFHGDCLEGLASGPAIAARAGAAPERLPPEHPIWTSVSIEIGQAIADLLLVTAAQRIVVGGGVGHGCAFLLQRIQAAAFTALAGYGPVTGEDTLGHVIVHPALGSEAGPLGSIVLAQTALS